MRDSQRFNFIEGFDAFGAADIERNYFLKSDLDCQINDYQN
jgi:hypothetical protein